MDQIPQLTRLELKHPVTLAGQVYAHLDFARLKTKHMRGIKVGTEVAMGQVFDVAASLANVPPQVIDELEPEDGRRVFDLVLSFFPASQASGGDSAPSSPPGSAGN